MTGEDKIFGLIAVAEEHQKAVNAAIDGLAVERAALAQAVQGVRSAAGEAVASAARQSFADAAEMAVAAFSNASEPFTRDVRDVAAKVGEAAGQVNSAARWIGVKACGLRCGLHHHRQPGRVGLRRLGTTPGKRSIRQGRAVADADRAGAGHRRGAGQARRKGKAQLVRPRAPVVRPGRYESRNIWRGTRDRHGHQRVLGIFAA